MDVKTITAEGTIAQVHIDATIELAQTLLAKAGVEAAIIFTLSPNPSDPETSAVNLSIVADESGRYAAKEALVALTKALPEAFKAAG